MAHQFITEDEFRGWSNIDDDESSLKLVFIIKSASSIVLDHIKKPNLIGWDLDKPETMPQQIKIATCLVAATLYDDREAGNPMSDAVLNILMPLRDPASC